jgi:guanine nucleotide-binding protein subunit alpha
VENALLRRLDPSGEDFEATQLGSSWLSSSKELFVRSSSNWKEKLARITQRASQTGSERSNVLEDIHLESPVDLDNPEDPGYIIQACKDDMITLWHDPIVRQVLRIGNVRLEEMPGL